MELFSRVLAALLAGQILFEPVDVVIAVDDGGFPHQGAEQG
jgi:hypothetical protein